MATAQQERDYAYNRNWNETLEQYLARTGAGGAATPSGLYKAFALPGADEAMTGLRGLQTDSVTGLRALLGKDTTARAKEAADALYALDSDNINYEADRTLQSGLEGMGARNLLDSTITGDYVREPLERARLGALSRAKQSSVLGGSQQAIAEQNAQLTALGQAFNSGTQGLQGEANVGLASTGRQQQESQFGRQLASSERQAQLNREQQSSLQDKAFANTKEIASNQMLGAGLGAGIGGLASLFGPTLNRSLFGV
ncbi:MAG TPA: hypothetical protein VD970_16315 [Acetobacteraceae bacterium]|nr:hypothetical protein [Acetobacteraceae bacterium]